MRFGYRLGASPPSVSAAERSREEGRFTAPDDGRSERLRASKSRLVVGGAWSGLSAIAGPVSQGCVATQSVVSRVAVVRGPLRYGRSPAARAALTWFWKGEEMSWCEAVGTCPAGPSGSLLEPGRSR